VGLLGFGFVCGLEHLKGRLLCGVCYLLVTLDLVCRLSIWWRAGFGAEVGFCEVIGLCLVPLIVVGLLCLFGV
jgi:hypothetical protein